MQDASHPDRNNQPLPVVLTAEEICLYIHGGSPANDVSPERRQEMSTDELTRYYLDTDETGKTNHLNPEKMPVLEAQLRDPTSWVNRALKQSSEQIQGKHVDWSQLFKPRGPHKGDRAGAPDPRPNGGDPLVAVDRDVIVRFVRDAAECGRLPQGTATRVLAETGESLSWVDSVPDRLIMSEPIAPIGNSPVERRKQLAQNNPVLSDLIAQQNETMCSKLAETHPDLAAEVRHRVTESRNDPGQNSGRGA